MAMYNPVTDSFTEYVPTEPAKVELEDPLRGIIDISDWASRVTSNGIPIASPNTPDSKEYDWSFLDNMAARHSIPSDSSNFEGGALIDNERFAYEYLVKEGLPKGTAAGIVGNLYHEDLANPTRTIKDSHGTTAYGIAGFNSGGEYPALMAWAKKKGIKGNPNFQQQLDFILDAVKNRSSLKELLNTNISPEEASFIWGSKFERFAGDNNKDGFKNRQDSHHIRRANRANLIFRSYG